MLNTHANRGNTQRNCSLSANIVCFVVVAAVVAIVVVVFVFVVAAAADKRSCRVRRLNGE